MRDYFYHRLDESGAFVAAETRAFDTDAAAIGHALSRAFPHGCELWETYRLVGRFCGPTGPARLAPIPPAAPDVSIAA
jgi:hypothetical protein